MLEKNFDDWNIIKKDLNEGESPQFHEREIWYCSVGENIGMEENGKNKNFERPILILKKFNTNVFLAFPLSGRHKDLPFYYLLDYPEVSSVLLSQIRLFDAKRLVRKVRKIPKQEFEIIRNKFKSLI